MVLNVNPLLHEQEEGAATPEAKEELSMQVRHPESKALAQVLHIFPHAVQALAVVSK